MHQARASLPLLLLALLMFGVLAGLRPLEARAEDDAQDVVTRAYEAWMAGDLEEALALSEEAVSADAATSYAWTLRGYVLSRAGRKQEAREAYRTAAELDPTDPVAQNNLGAVLLQLGEVEEAKEPLSRAVALDDRYADAHNNLGAAYERSGRAAEAESAYRKATTADPRHTHAHNNLGALALQQGRTEEARAALQRARDLAPASSVPAMNLLLLGGRDLAPGALFDRLQEAAAAPGAPPRVRARALAALAGRATQERDFHEAYRLYLEALALQPDDAVLLNNIAVAEDQLGHDRDAMVHLEAALALEPEMLVARNNMGIVHAHRGALELAEGVYRGILEKDPRFHRAHYNLGVVLAAQGDLAGAASSLERAAALSPQDADVRYNLGLIRRRLGGTAEAEIRAYRHALRLDANLSEAHLALGCVLADPQTRADLRDERQARVHLERFLDLSLPSDDEGREEAQAWLDWLAEKAATAR